MNQRIYTEGEDVMAGKKNAYNISAMSNFEIIEEMEDLLKKYSKKPDNFNIKRDIIKYLQNAKIILPAVANFEMLHNFEDQISDVILKPDIVKDSEGKRMIPIFTSLEQIPEDYAEHFSLIRVQSRVCYNVMNARDDVDGMVINPFTKAMPLFKKAKIQTEEEPIEESCNFALMHNGKKYVVNKWPFTIGRVGTDLEIDEAYISKIHAVLAHKNNKYVIADNDSTNGTSVNGIQLKPKVPVVLHNGYKIEIADEEEFTVYINE